MTGTLIVTVGPPGVRGRLERRPKPRVKRACAITEPLLMICGADGNAPGWWWPV